MWAFPIRKKHLMNLKSHCIFLTHSPSFCMLFLKSIQQVCTLPAPVMKLVDMQVLGTCAVRCVGSSPTGGNSLFNIYLPSLFLSKNLQINLERVERLKLFYTRKGKSSLQNKIRNKCNVTYVLLTIKNWHKTRT